MNHLDSILWLNHTLKYFRYIFLIYKVIFLKIIKIIYLSFYKTLNYLDKFLWLYHTLK